MTSYGSISKCTHAHLRILSCQHSVNNYIQLEAYRKVAILMVTYESAITRMIRHSPKYTSAIYCRHYACGH